MTRLSITSLALFGSLCLGVPANAQSAPPEDLISTVLSGSNDRLFGKWDLNGDFDAEISVTVAPDGPLAQYHGVRFAIYTADGTPVEGGETLVGETNTFTFQLGTGTYYLLFDLGVEDPEFPTGSVNLDVKGRLFTRGTGIPIPIKPLDGDIPRDPYYPPPSEIYLPGPVPMPMVDFVPTHDWMIPRLETMIYAVDWV